MTNLFIPILNMSIRASIVTLAVMLVRLPLKKAPKVFSYALWGVVLFRLVCPFSFESVFSLMPATGNAIPQDIVYSQAPEIQTGIQFLDTPINAAIGNALQTVSMENSANPVQEILQIAGYIWLIGFFALLLYTAIGYIILKRQIYYATLICDNVYETDSIKMPFVLGFIRPKIYMPLGIEAFQYDYIFKHEQVHIRRRDYLIKPIAFIALALHWFNPFIWAAYFLMAKDMEMSCDEAVLKTANEDIRGDYSSTLLNLSVKRVSLISPIAFGESNVKERVKNVLKFKKHSRLIAVFAFILVFAVTICSAANRVNPGINNEMFGEEIVYVNKSSISNKITLGIKSIVTDGSSIFAHCFISSDKIEDIQNNLIFQVEISTFGAYGGSSGSIILINDNENNSIQEFILHYTVSSKKSLLGETITLKANYYNEEKINTISEWKFKIKLNDTIQSTEYLMTDDINVKITPISISVEKHEFFNQLADNYKLELVDGKLIDLIDNSAYDKGYIDKNGAKISTYEVSHIMFNEIINPSDVAAIWIMNTRNELSPIKQID